LNKKKILIFLRTEILKLINLIK